MAKETLTSLPRARLSGSGSRAALLSSAAGKKLLEELSSIFTKKNKKADVHDAEREAGLYRQIGQLSVELEYLTFPEKRIKKPMPASRTFCS